MHKRFTAVKDKEKHPVSAGCFLVRLTGIEPALPAPEAGALSSELQARATYLY